MRYKYFKLVGTPAQSTASDAGDRRGGRVKIGPPPYIYKIPLPDNYKNTTALSSPPRTTGNEPSVSTPHSIFP